MSQAPWTRDAIVDLLQLHPDGLTKREIAEELERTLANITSTIRHDRDKNGSERFRIIGYRRGPSRHPTRSRNPRPATASATASSCA